MTELPSRRGLVHVPREILASGGQAPFAGYLDRAVDLGRNRLVILAGLFVFAFLAIAVRVVELALPVVDGGDGIAQTHRVQSGSDRADIVDRNGVIVATNLATALLEADATELPDRDEVLACLKSQGGLDQCKLAFYTDPDLGNDGVWDNWRLEGPSFVWYFRGAPHVHVWVNVADDPSVKLNA